MFYKVPFHFNVHGALSKCQTGLNADIGLINFLNLTFVVARCTSLLSILRTFIYLESGLPRCNSSVSSYWLT